VRPDARSLAVRHKRVYPSSFPEQVLESCTNVSATCWSSVSKAARMLRALARRDTVVMKALAISAIVFHNYFHLLANSVRENEFDFDAARFRRLMEVLPDPALAIQGLFSFFGHFGVQVFIFLSAYGLAKSHWEDPSSWHRFLWGRVKKLYPVFGLIVLPWLLMYSIVTGPVKGLSTGVQLLCMGLGISSLLPGVGLPPIGPWWFIPFIIQFYALWPLICRFVKRFGPRGLLGAACLSMLILVLANPYLLRWSINLLETPIGHLPELCLGIVAARYRTHPRTYYVIGAIFVLLLGSVLRTLWPLTFMAALVVFVVAYFRLRGFLRSSAVLQTIGRYSLLVFLLNGFVRFFFLPYAATPSLALPFALISALTCFTVAAILQSVVLPIFLEHRMNLEPMARRLPSLRR
jgi:peptidoglycan/LPS O-acetylase OafA/YrhL